MMEHAIHSDGWFFFGHGLFGLLWCVVIIAIIVLVIKTLGTGGDK